MLHKLAETLELGFWKLAIPLMTQSKAIRALIRSVYKIYNDPRLKKDLALSLAVSCAGFAFSVALFSLMLLLA